MMLVSSCRHYIHILTDVHCQPQFNYCSDKADCFEIKDVQDTGCNCYPGYIGSGVNTSFANNGDYEYIVQITASHIGLVVKEN